MIRALNDESIIFIPGKPAYEFTCFQAFDLWLSTLREDALKELSVVQQSKEQATEAKEPKDEDHSS